MKELMENPPSPEDARRRLRGVQILSDASDADLNVLAARLTWRSVHPGDEIVSHLDRGNQVFFAIEGEFTAKLQPAFGRDVAIRQLRPGAHFGEIAALSRTPRSLTVVADSLGLLAECPAETFVALMERDGKFATRVAAHLARHVISLTDRVFELAALEMRFRVYAELLRLTASGEKTEHGILIREAPTQETIAIAIGAQREAVNRELRTLSNQGLIRQTKRELLILDPERLRDLLRRRAGAMTSEAVDWQL